MFLSLGPTTRKSLILQLDPDDDEEEDRLKRELEKPFADDVARALDDQRNALIPANATEDDLMLVISRVDETSEPVRVVLRRHLLAGADLGLNMSLSQLNNVELAFDYTLAHTQASEWANGYAFDLVSQLNDTTRRRLQSAVDQWFREATTIADLREELIPLFGEKRAGIIAQTETTRAAAKGTLLGYAVAGYGEGQPTEEIPGHIGCRCWWALEILRDGSAYFIWKSAFDDRVCPICGPRHNQRFGLARSKRS